MYKIKQANEKEIYSDKDIVVSKHKLKEYLDSDLKIGTKYNLDGWIEFKNKLISIKNITYLGSPHSFNKKRIQFSNGLINSYNKKSENKIILGHYINKKGGRLYVDFNLNSNKVGKSKSSHVYVEDLQLGFLLPYYYSRIDKRKNKISVIKPEHLKQYINDIGENNRLEEFAQIILSKYPKWDGRSAYREMIANNFRAARGNMWAGWFLEYLAEKEMRNKNGINVGKQKKIGNWEPDIFTDIPIDLKYHDNSNKNIMGNDYDGIHKAIKIYGKVGIFVVLGKNKKDEDLKMTNWWYNNVCNNGKKIHSKSKKVVVSIEVNDIGYFYVDYDIFKTLKLFKQGKNSDGKKRKPKLMFNVNLIEKLY